MKIVEFEARHLKWLRPRVQERHRLGMIEDIEGYAESLAIPGLSFTGLEDGFVVGCAGVVPLHNGVGEVWALLSALLPAEPENMETRRRWVEMHRVVKTFLESVEGFHRLQTVVIADFKAGHRWAEKLGFKHEGVMSEYGPDKTDFVRYARIYG